MRERRQLLAFCLTLVILAAISTANSARASSCFVRIQELKESAPAQQITSGVVDTPNLDLADGVYFVQAQPPAKAKLFLRTRFVAIRIPHSAELLIQTSDSACRIAVLKGEAILKNLTERSIIKVGAGEVYETISSGALLNMQQQRIIGDIEIPSSKTPVFRTRHFQTNLFTIDAESLMQQQPSLVKDPGLRYPKDTSERAQILSPPTTCNYEISPDSAHKLPIPPTLVQHFPPSGLMPADQSTGSGMVADTDVTR